MHWWQNALDRLVPPFFVKPKLIIDKEFFQALLSKTNTCARLKFQAVRKHSVPRLAALSQLLAAGESFSLRAFGGSRPVVQRRQPTSRPGLLLSPTERQRTQLPFRHYPLSPGPLGDTTTDLRSSCARLFYIYPPASLAPSLRLSSASVLVFLPCDRVAVAPHPPLPRHPHPCKGVVLIHALGLCAPCLLPAPVQSIPCRGQYQYSLPMPMSSC